MVPHPPVSLATHEWLEPMHSGPLTLATRQEKIRGAPDIVGLRNKESPAAVVRAMSASPQRFMLLRPARASGAMLTERAASPPLSSSGD